MTIDISLVLVILNFILLMIVLNHLLYKPLRKFFEERQNQIKNDVEEAKLSIDRAAELVVEKENELQQAYIEAKTIKDNISHDANVRAESIVELAKKTAAELEAKEKLRLIDMAKHAKIELELDLADIIVDLTAKVLSEKLDEEKDKQLILNLLSKRGE